MNPSFKIMTAAAVLALAVLPAAAQTVTTQTVVTHKPVPGPVVVNFNAFDLDGDNILSMREVGEKLFYTFDRDGNQLIDNIEFDKTMVLTLAPMEKQTLQLIDYDGDGLADVSQKTHTAFLKESGLTRFDEMRDGLSAADFIEMPFKTVDRDWSGQIDVREWKEAYFASLRPLPQNDSFRYND